MCVVSAHWVTPGTQALKSEHPPTIHDFYGFPKPLYEVQYPAPGAPEEAAKVASDPEIVKDESWGLDHGAWGVLRHMYPKADMPAFQLSLDERRGFKEHLELGREIRNLRERRHADSGQREHRPQLAPDRLGQSPLGLRLGFVSSMPRLKLRSTRMMLARLPSRRSGARRC